MVDFASGLMSFATGAVKGGLELQKQRNKRELGIIESAEEDAATQVSILVEAARKTMQSDQDVFNQTSQNLIKNFNQLESEYKNTPELLDDLSVLAVSRPDLFQGDDLGLIRENVNKFFSAGEKITPDSAAFKQFETDYGAGATGSSVFSQQQDAYNEKIRGNMANLVGANSTKLFLNIPEGSKIRDRTVEKYQGEGRVASEDFAQSLGQFTSSEMRDTGSAPKADYLGMAGMRAMQEIEGNPFKTPAGELAKMAYDKDLNNKSVTPINWINTQVDPASGEVTSDTRIKTITREQYYNDYYRNRIQGTPAGNTAATFEIIGEGVDTSLTKGELAMYNAIITNKDPVGARLLVNKLVARGLPYAEAYPDLAQLASQETIERVR